MTKIGTEVAQVTRDSVTTFKVKGQKSTCRGGGILWRPRAQLFKILFVAKRRKGKIIFKSARVSRH